MYRVNIENGYITSLVSGVGQDVSNISQEEYFKLRSIVNNPPKAENGYYYKLKETLEWELYQLPEPEPEADEESTEADYQSALAEMGVEYHE